jgi:hypothetical protein
MRSPRARLFRAFGRGRATAWAALGLAFAVCQVAAVAADRFQITIRTLQLPEMGTVTNWILRTADGAFCFMPPFGSSIYGDTAERFFSLTRAGSPTIFVRLHKEPNRQKQPLNREALRERVLRDRAQAKVVDEGIARTESEEGFFFDVRWATSSGTVSQSRHVFVRVKGVLFEFSTTAPPGQFEAATSPLQDLLTSFQALTEEDR